jgi:hypothetical protein
VVMMVMAMIVRVVVAVIVRMIVRVAVIVIVTMPVFVDRLHAGSDGDRGDGLRIQQPAEYQHHRRSSQREQRDQPNQV